MCYKSSCAAQTAGLIRKGILFLILSAAACNEGMFSKEYMRALEKYSPCSFKGLRRFYGKVRREYGKLRLKLAVMPVEVSMARALASGRL